MSKVTSKEGELKSLRKQVERQDETIKEQKATIEEQEQLIKKLHGMVGEARDIFKEQQKERTREDIIGTVGGSTVGGTLTLDILLVGKIPRDPSAAYAPIFVSGEFVITIGGDVVQGTFSITQIGWDPSLSSSRGTFVGYGDMNVKGRISKASGTDIMVWEGLSW